MHNIIFFLKTTTYFVYIFIFKHITYRFFLNYFKISSVKSKNKLQKQVHKTRNASTNH